MDNNKSWDWFDYIIIFAYPIGNLLFIWYTLRKGGGSVDTAIIAAIISCGGVLLGVLLKHFLYDRKQYKDILKRLGKFENMPLETSIGDTSKYGSITSQIHHVTGVTTDNGSLSLQHKQIEHKIGDTSKGSLTSQVQDVLTAAHNINNQIAREQRLASSLTPEQFQLKTAIDNVTYVTSQWIELLRENSSLKAELIHLQEDNACLRERLSEYEDELDEQEQ